MSASGTRSSSSEEADVTRDRTQERGERSVLLRTRGGFLGVHPKRDCLDLQIVTDHAIRAARVTKVGPVSARRFHVHVRVATEKHVDGRLLEWLREAYDLMA